MRSVLCCVMMYHSYVCVLLAQSFLFFSFLPVLYSFGRVMVGHSSRVFFTKPKLKDLAGSAWLGRVWGGYRAEVRGRAFIAWLKGGSFCREWVIWVTWARVAEETGFGWLKFCTWTILNPAK